MKKTWVTLIPVLLALPFLLLLANPVHAFFPSEVDASRDPELSGPLGEVIGSQWFQRKNALLTGQDPLGKVGLEAIYQAQLDRGIRNIPLLAVLLIRESQRVLERREVDEAEILCEYAKKYAPDFPSAYFAMARVHWCRNKAQVHVVLREYARGVYAGFNNFRVLFNKSINLVYLVSASLLLTFIVCCIIIGIKYFPLFLHDIRREFDLAPAKMAASLFKVLAFVVPLILHLDILWTLFYWAVLMWGYLARRERQMVFVFLIVLVYAPWILNRTTDFLESPDPALLIGLYQANHENWNRATRRDLNKWNKQRPEDADVLFTLGLLSKREGLYTEAEQYYREALQYDANWTSCISNLGNVYLVTNRIDAAIEQYQRAISLSPEKASFYFNLHRAFARDSVLSSEKVGQALEMANRLDSDLVAFQTGIYKENANRSVIDDMVGTGRLWDRAIRVLEKQRSLRQSLIEPWTRRVSERYAPVCPVVWLVFLIVFSFFCSKRVFRKRCPICGTPSVKFFARKIQGDMVCFGCNRLFVRRESIDPKMKEKRMRQVRSFGKRKVVMRAILSLIVPGGGHLWKDQSVKGSILVFVFFVFGLKLLYWNGIVRDSMAMGSASGSWCWFAFMVLFVLYYLGVLRSSFRIES